MTSNPVLVEVIRGAMVESAHRGAAAVVTADGSVHRSWGDVERPVYPRSAIKPLQAIPLVESGAAERFGLGDAEIALAAGSHRGTPLHVNAIAAWLARLGLGAEHLECGAQAPFSATAAEALRREGKPFTALHHNSSGKHAGFLTTALHMQEPLQGYIRPEHPVQRRVAQVIGEMTGADLDRAPCGLEGCGIRVYGIPLFRLALGMARLVAPAGLPPQRAAAARRVWGAMAAHPELVLGPGRLSTVIMEITAGAVIVKGGSEGVFVAAIPDRGMGLALKIDDGAQRAADVALLAILDQLGVLAPEHVRVLSDRMAPVLTNALGTLVGTIRPCFGSSGVRAPNGSIRALSRTPW
jgi:L-asparaginase II